MAVAALVVFGLYAGSFVNALVWRLGTGDPDAVRALVLGRSMCASCNHVLGAMDLVPVLSWVWLRGRCRYCGERIEDGPLVELAVPLLWVLSYLLWPAPLRGVGLVRFALWLLLLVGVVAVAASARRRSAVPLALALPVAVLAAAEVVLATVRA